MLNHYPLWKYLILLIILFFGCLYALPNLYGEDSSIQITGLHGNILHENTLVQIENLLKKNHVESKSIAWKNGSVLVRFSNTSLQLQAREVITKSVGKNYIVALNLSPATPHWLSSLRAEPMKLGLDLRGGIHFLMEVDIDSALSKLQQENLENLRSDLYDKKIPYIELSKSNFFGLKVGLLDQKSRDKVRRDILSHYHDIVIHNSSYNFLTVEVNDERIRSAREYAIEQNINVLRNRITQLGLTDAIIQRQGNTFVVVELPGIQDTARAKEILSSMATLEFRLVNMHINIDALLPQDSELKYTRDGQALVVHKHVILTGDHIIHSTTSIDEYNQIQVNISLDREGGRIMSNFTKDHIGQAMATIFIEYQGSGKKDIRGRAILEKHDEIINVAYIQSQLGSSFRISGINNQKEARHLSLLLRSGAFVAPIQIVEERIIGPTMVEQNITQGLEACLWGVIVSILFMVLRYKLFGLVASLALLANLVLIIGIMSLLPGATLTMPGIAGIVLTLVVAVDANVLINERIKEELRNERSIQMAIHQGYKRAFSSIIDANITTLIKVIVLYVLGSGSIKGFAITTAIGIATSMLTAIIGTRAIINLIYGGKRVKKLSI
ncbi:protein translocase subunit SecD [Candidatus Erwinia haradaeae]|uniref:Protein translocase subunit SecD n=1 Tax=Candidatus Erwinia haradaeae TaxID=1922217 RepID=A0A451D8G7_9GAMM|nr:protein translocase subunit SecD [Candidatus Erwinia haradaeae]VFP82065.1 Protein translocase subunit SecD [Candidatus Erwinia haradaeae]